MRSRGHSTRGAAAGFTLIELLVALTIFGVISVVIMGGLRFGTRVWETGGERAEILAEVEAVQGILRRYMSQAIVPQPFGQQAEDSKLFLGEQERLRLVTVVPAHIGVGGLYQVEIAKFGGDTNDDGALELKWSLFRPDNPFRIEDIGEEDEDTPVGGRRLLLSGVKSIAFKYMGLSSTGQDSFEWNDTWPDTDVLPALISLKISFVDGSHLFWPELVVQTRLARAGR